jgi:hypothetical protein
VAGTAPEAAAKVAGALTAMGSDDPAAKSAKVVGWREPLDYVPVAALQQSLGIGQ